MIGVITFMSEHRRVRYSETVETTDADARATSIAIKSEVRLRGAAEISSSDPSENADKTDERIINPRTAERIPAPDKNDFFSSSRIKFPQ